MENIEDLRSCTIWEHLKMYNPSYFVIYPYYSRESHGGLYIIEGSVDYDKYTINPKKVNYLANDILNISDYKLVKILWKTKKK